MKKGLDKLVGMRREKARARIDIAACLKTGEVFPHTLLEGVGGTGKTALALAIAEELGYYSIVTEAAALKTREQVIQRLRSAHAAAEQSGKPLLLFIDEVQRFSEPQQEVFYYPLDRRDPRILLPTETIHLAPFTLMAATTRRDELDEASFVKRFGNIWQIHRYCLDDLIVILAGYFQAMNIKARYEHTSYLAKRSLGIPRQALRLAGKVRNVFLASNHATLTMAHCQLAIKLEGIDPIGLEELHVEYLRILAESPGPRGVGGIAGRLGQQVEVIEETVEPTLLHLGMMDRTSRGRVIMPKGLKHLETFHKKP
jgi:Holliday junction DNA helicase RuvB